MAVDVNDSRVVEQIGVFQSKIADAGKAVEPHNLHFTLQFLGEISADTTNNIADTLKSIQFSPFDVKLCGAGTFGRPPRIVWIGTDPYTGRKLSGLAHAVQNAIGGSSKPFKPHLTISRIKRGRSVDISGYGEWIWGMQHINSIKLKSSILYSTGPIYTDIVEVVAI